MDTKVTIITPCCRPQNLPRLFASINFEYVNHWIIIYDTSKGREYQRRYTENTSIIEAEYHHLGISGNDQRNFGLKFVSTGFVYFLDDDNIMHRNFWAVFPHIMNENRYIYSFDLEKEDGSIKLGNEPFLHIIDTAMVLIPHSLIKGLQWYKHFTYSDGIFISTLYEKNKSNFLYIPQILCYYNKLA